MKKKVVSGNFFNDVRRLLSWGWKKRPKGKGRLGRIWEEMNK